MAEVQEVPMVTPATVQKNPDGTYSVRIQHYVSGVVSEVHFPHVYFAEALANGYATYLNSKTKAVTAVKDLTTSTAPDAKETILAAKKEATRLIEMGQAEANKLRKEAEEFYSLSVSTLARAKTEASAIIAGAKTAVADPKPAEPPVAKTEPVKPPVAAPAKPMTPAKAPETIPTLTPVDGE